MKRERNFYITALCVGAWCMFVGPVVEGHDFGADEGGLVIAVMQHGPVLWGSCIIMAMVAMLLGWHWLKLARAIASIAKIIQTNVTAKDVASGNVFASLRISQINKLCGLIKEHFDCCAGHVSDCEKQIKDFTKHFNKKYNEAFGALSYSDGKARLIVDHVGTARHLHVQVRKGV